MLERALGDELVGELVPARAHLATDEAVVAEAVLADPVEPRRVDVDGDGRLSLLVAHAMDVPGAAPARVPGPKVELDVRRPVDEEILADTALRAAQPDARDVVVVEAGSLPGIHESTQASTWSSSYTSS